MRQLRVRTFSFLSENNVLIIYSPIQTGYMVVADDMLGTVFRILPEVMFDLLVTEAVSDLCFVL